MKKQKKLILGISALVVAGVGAYLIFRKKPNRGSIITPQKPSEFQKFRVSTQTSNLNVRSAPSASGSTIASLPKGSIIFARESSTSGWYEYSQDGINVTGYVSKLYLSSDLSGSNSGSGSTSGSYSKYKVTTISSNLNVRDTPNGITIITSLPKGAIVWAKPSGTSGWFEYSADGKTTTGYVSETYLQLI